MPDDNEDLRRAITRITELASEGDGLLAALQSGNVVVPSGLRREEGAPVANAVLGAPCENVPYAEVYLPATRCVS